MGTQLAESPPMRFSYGDVYRNHGRHVSWDQMHVCMCVPVSVHIRPSESLLLLFVTWKLKCGNSDWQIMALSFILAYFGFKAERKWKLTYCFLENHYNWNDYKIEQSSSTIRVDQYTCVHWFSVGMKCNRLKNGKHL